MGAEWRFSAVSRLLAKAERSPNGCLLWLGRTTADGYGTVGYRGATVVGVHRVAYLELVGPIPTGMQIDHTCHTRDQSCRGGPDCLHRRCIEPSHLEVVTPGENTKRGRSFSAVNASKTHCPSGHCYDDANTTMYEGRRYCRECTRILNRAYKARKRTERANS